MWLYGSIAVVGLAVLLIYLVDRRRGAQGESRGSDLPGTIKRDRRSGGGESPYGGAGGMADGGF